MLTHRRCHVSNHFSFVPCIAGLVATLLSCQADFHGLDSSPLSIFSCPKGKKSISTQANEEIALRSWLALQPKPHVTLLEANEQASLTDICQKHRVAKIRMKPSDSTKYGAPKLASLFKYGERTAVTGLLCYINADILLPPDFMQVVSFVFSRFSADKHARIVIVGGRTNCENTEIGTQNIANELKETNLADLSIVENRMTLCEPAGEGAKDYFVFPKGFYRRLGGVPPFALGRGVFDHWLLKVPHHYGIVVDVSPVVTALHMNHNYAHARGLQVSKKNQEFSGRDSDMNKRLESVSLKKLKIKAPRSYMGNLRSGPHFRVCPEIGHSHRSMELDKSEIKFVLRANDSNMYPKPNRENVSIFRLGACRYGSLFGCTCSEQ